MLARCSASSLSVAAGGFAVCVAYHVHGAVIELAAVSDTTLYESATGALGNGAGQYLFAGTTNQPQLRRALISFDAAGALPEQAIIESVQLTLHVASASAQTHSFSLHRVTSAWGEGLSDAVGNEGSGAAAMMGDATWLYSSWPGIAWTNPGGDFSTVASAATSVGDIGFYSWTSTQLRDDVRAWLADPSAQFGWILRGDESSPGTTRRFDSSEAIDALLVPTLTISYSIAPAPGSIALLALSLLVARSRRR